MHLNVPPDLETLSVKDVLRSALEAQDAEQSWTEEERRELFAHIEEGYLSEEGYLRAFLWLPPSLKNQAS